MRLFGIATSFLAVTLLARWLGPEEYGVYAYVLATVLLLATPLQNAIRALIVRETSQALESNEWSFVTGIWHWASYLTALLTLVFGVFALALARTISTDRPAIGVTPIYFGLLLLPLLVLCTSKGAALTGLRYVVLGQLPDNVLRPILFLTMLVLVYIFFPTLEWSAHGALGLLVGSAVITLLSMGFLLRWRCPKVLSLAPRRYRHKFWSSALGPLALASGLQVVNSHADILVLGLFSPVSEVGIYRAVTQLASIIMFGLGVINLIAEPDVARLHAAGQIVQLQQVVTKYARLAFLLAVPVVAVSLIFGDDILELLFGEDYRGGYGPLVILVIGQVINVAMGSVGLLLNMTGHEKAVARGVAVAAMLNVPLNFILIPYWGASGAAFASTVSLVVWNLLLWRQVYRRLGIESTILKFNNRRQ